MTTILAIDAAWTTTNPSGLALVSTTSSGWRCVTVAASYKAFFGMAAGMSPCWTGPFTGQAPDVSRLLCAARCLAGAPVDLVTIDMPIATVPITGRREADGAVSRLFGGRGYSTHTPNAVRPGELNDSLSQDLAVAGFPIATTTTVPATSQRLLEVYPHTALLSLLGRKYRIPYKIARAQRYWPTLSRAKRIHALLIEFDAIREALSACFGPIDVPLPVPDGVRTLNELKKYEDALDALVCAWVGTRYLDGATVALGDGTAAIWCLLDVCSSPALQGE